MHCSSFQMLSQSGERGIGLITNTTLNHSLNPHMIARAIKEEEKKMYMYTCILGNANSFHGIKVEIAIGEEKSVIKRLM